MENSAKIVEFAQNFQLHKISAKNILLKITNVNEPHCLIIPIGKPPALPGTQKV
jgi:hypothetical protein